MSSRGDRVPVTVFVPILNESANLKKCLDSVAGFQQVFVIDSGSTDGSKQIAIDHGAEFVEFSYSGSYPKKRQWALENLGIETEWVLMLDADEEMTENLEKEISQAVAAAKFDAFLITKGFHFLGKKFRFGGFSHSAVLLMRPAKCRFERLDIQETSGMDMEVHERVLVDGDVGRLKHPLVHNDFKGLQAYIDRHNRYSSWEAAVRLKQMADDANDDQLKPSLFGNVQQKRRWLKMLAIRIPGEPWLWFFYHYFLRMGFLEGRRGLIASQQRRQYISNVRAKMFENRTTNRTES